MYWTSARVPSTVTVPPATTLTPTTWKHGCGHFAEPKGQRRKDKAKRQRVESAGDMFGVLMDADALGNETSHAHAPLQRRIWVTTQRVLECATTAKAAASIVYVHSCTTSAVRCDDPIHPLSTVEYCGRTKPTQLTTVVAKFSAKLWQNETTNAKGKSTRLQRGNAQQALHAPRESFARDSTAPHGLRNVGRERRRVRFQDVSSHCSHEPDCEQSKVGDG